MLQDHPRIKDVAVVGLRDPEWGESVLAVVMPEEGQTISSEEVIAFSQDRLAAFKKPRYVAFLDELPVTTATGKVQKAALRKQYAHLTAANPG